MSIINSIRNLFGNSDRSKPNTNYVGYYEITKEVIEKTKIPPNPKKIYRDPTTLPVDILNRILNRFIPLETCARMMLVNHAWKKKFETNEFLDGIFSNYFFVNRQPGEAYSIAYPKDVKTKKNIRTGNFTSVKVDAPDELQIKSLCCYRNGLAILSNDKIFNFNKEGSFEKLNFDISAVAILVDADKLFTITFENQIVEIHDDRSSTLLFDVSTSKIDFKNVSQVFFKRLNDTFIIAYNQPNPIKTESFFSFLHVVNKEGVISKNYEIDRPISSIMAFKNSIAVGLDAEIEFYDNKLNYLKTFSGFEIELCKKNVIPLTGYSLSNFNGHLVSSAKTGLTCIWSDDGKYRLLESCIRVFSFSETTHSEGLGESFAILVNERLHILNDKNHKVDILKDQSFMDFTVCQDQIIAYTPKSITYLDFSPKPVFGPNENPEKKPFNILGTISNFFTK
ncbi:MAG: hypothetical protein JHC93_07390 [Parachlamydiales bacterium]|nr:hypothetical protein [Parachlamydiales bacterium]